jgi:ABC-type multidrug transport system fused ATPase/permease subunit
MTILLRCLYDHRGLWRVGTPLLLLAILQPLFVSLLPLIERYLVDDVVLARRLDLLAPVATAYAALWLVPACMQIANGALRVYVAEQMSIQLRRRLFAHCEALSLAFSQREHSGRTTALFVNDVAALVGLFNSTTVDWVGNVVGIAVGTALMYSLNPQLAIAVGILPFVVAAFGSVVTRPLRAAARRVQEKAADLSQRIYENLAGLREIVAFGQGAAQGRQFATALADLMRIRMRLTYMDSALQGGQTVFSLAVTLTVLVYGGYLVIRGETTLGTLIAMRALFARTVYPAGQFLGLFASVQKTLASADRLYAFLDEAPQVRERAGACAPKDLAGAVQFERVSFAYRPGEPVLRSVSFAVAPGEMTALVGPSGAGKSTLVSLVSRFYDPSGGRVLIDGVDVRDLTLNGLRRHIAIVFQNTFLFAGSIRENIGFGREGATEAEIVVAAHAANAWEFIERLPNGLDSYVGERGVRLSEGQKQRVAIARALLRDPRILILDEPTSALDARSEHLLQSALENLMRGRTTFVIAHRLATVRRADRILVLDQGRLAEAGTHGELLRRGGLYRELFDLQFGGMPLGTTPAVEAVPV